MSVMFIETRATPYSGMNQPMAFCALECAGYHNRVALLASFSGFPTGEPPSRIGRPFAHVECYGVGAAGGGGVEVEVHGDEEIACAHDRRAAAGRLLGVFAGAEVGRFVRVGNSLLQPLRIRPCGIRRGCAFPGRCAAAS